MPETRAKMQEEKDVTSVKRSNVIIDCDPGIDDSLAIMLALSLESISVKGITIVCGNSPVEMGFGNAKKVLHFLKRLDIPVYQGEKTPLKWEYVNALDTHGEDGLGESFLPEIPGYEQNETAVEFMGRIIRECAAAGEPCSVIALGPMTNLARLIQTDREAFDQIQEIISMGGNFKSHGNCSPVAEYNYWVDPDASALVYETAAQKHSLISMVGLDVTRKIVLTPDLLEYMKRLKPEIGSFVQKITKFYFDFHWEWEHLIGCVINDPLAVAYFADRSLCSGIQAYTAVETGGISMGQTVVDAMDFYRKEPNAVILTEVDVLKFFKTFYSSILQIPKEKLDLLETLITREDKKHE